MVHYTARQAVAQEVLYFRLHQNQGLNERKIMLDAKLVVVGGQTESSEIGLCLPMVIGRGNESDLVISDALVSRRHAEIFEADGQIFVRDLGSLNGTFVNNHRIVDVEPLFPEQLLTLGTVTFRAIYTPVYTPVEVEAMAASDNRNAVTMDTVNLKSETADTVKVIGKFDNHQLVTKATAPSSAETTDLDSYLIELSSVKSTGLQTSVELEDHQPELDDHDSDKLIKLKRVPR